MTAQLLHPQRDMLEAFGLGKLDEDETAFVEQHLTECAACCATLLEMQDDTFIELVRIADTPRGADHGATRSAPRLGARQPVCHADLAASALPAELVDHPRYRVLELLGRGGMGEVYRAEHRLMHRPVALKVIHRRLMKDAHAVARFHREVQAAARLSHPNIVAAYDAEQAGDLHFLAMEYVEGIDLAALVQERGPLPVAEACEYIRQAADGLQHAHHRGMVHRDIKPQNLMLVESGERSQSGKRTAESREEEKRNCDSRANSSRTTFRCPPSAFVKILDFGLARFATDVALEEASAEASGDEAPARLTSWGTTLGTPDYIAPEQSRSARDADIRSDIYSLGCTLYFLLAGRPPFSEGGSQDKLQAHLHRPPPSLRTVRSDLPPGLEDVLARMMAKNPRDRYQTPAEAAAALAPFAPAPGGDAEGWLAAELAAPQRTTVKSWGGWAALGLAALAFLLILGVVIYVKLGETTVKFEINNPSLAVRFAENEITIDNDGQSLRITPGQKQTFTVAQNGLELQTTAFTLRKGEQVVLAVSMENGRVAVTPRGDPTPLDVKPHDGGRTPRGLAMPALPGTTPIVPSQPANNVASSSVLLKPTETFQGEHAGESFAHEPVAMGLSADRRTVATYHMGAVVALWDVEQRRQTVSWKFDPKQVPCLDELAFSPDGRRVATPVAGGVGVFDAHSGKSLHTFQNVTGLGVALEFSPDNQLLLYGEHLGLTVPPVSENGAVAGSRQHVLGSGRALRLWSLADGKEAADLELPQSLIATPGEKTRIYVSDVTFSPDGKHFAAASTTSNVEDQTVINPASESWITLWETATGRLLRQIPQVDTPAVRLAFTPDGEFLLSGHAGGEAQESRLRLWDTSTGNLVRTFPPRKEGAISLDIAPNGQLAVTVSNEGAVRVWSLATGRELAHAPAPPQWLINPLDGQLLGSRPIRAAFLADNQTFVTAETASVKLWRLPESVIAATGESGAAPIDPRKTVQSTAAPHLLRPTRRLRGKDAGSIKPITNLAMTRDRKTLIAFDNDAGAVVWDAAAWQVRSTWELALAVPRPFALLPQGNTLAVFDREQRRVQLRDLATGKAHAEFATEEDWINDLAASPAGDLLAASGVQGRMYDSGVAIFAGQGPVLSFWSLPRGEPVTPLDLPPLLIAHHHEQEYVWVNGVAFSPDGRYFAAVGEANVYPAEGTEQERERQEKRIAWGYVWNLQTGELLATLPAAATAATAVAYTPNNGFLITGHEGNENTSCSVLVWNADDHRLVKTIACSDGQKEVLRHLDLSPDNRLAVTTGYNGMVRVWDLTQGRQIAQTARAPSRAKTMLGGTPLTETAAHERDALFLADSRSLVTGSDQGLTLWRLPDGLLEAASTAEAAIIEPERSLAGEYGDGSQPIGSLAISADGKKLLFAQETGLVVMQEEGKKGEPTTWKTGVPLPTALALPANGALLGVGGAGVVEIWNTRSLKQTARFTDSNAHLRSLAFSPDGRWLVAGAMQRLEYRGGRPVVVPGPALRMWNVAENKERDWPLPELLAAPGARARIDVDAVRFSRSGRLLAVVGDVMRYDEVHRIEIEDFGFLWDVSTAQAPRRLDRVFTHATTAVFTPDEKWLITGHAGGTVAMCVLRVWDVETGQVVRELRGHKAPILSLDVSSDGKLAASVDGDGRLRIWSLATGRAIAQDEAPPALSPGQEGPQRQRHHVVFAADNGLLITAGVEGVKLWRLPEESIPDLSLP